MGDARRFVGVRLAPAGYDYVQHVAARDKVTFSEALRRLLSVGATTDWEKHGHRPGPDDRAERGVATGDVGTHEHPDRHRNGDRSSGHLPGVPQPTATDEDDPHDPGDGGQPLDGAGSDPRYARIPSDTSGPSHPRDSISYPTSDAALIQRHIHDAIAGLNHPSVEPEPGEDDARTA